MQKVGSKVEQLVRDRLDQHKVELGGITPKTEVGPCGLSQLLSVVKNGRITVVASWSR
jgi:hypothetical protein